MDDACVGPPGTKVLFWLTGVGVLAAKVQSTIDEDVALQGCGVLLLLQSELDFDMIAILLWPVRSSFSFTPIKDFNE